MLSCICVEFVHMRLNMLDGCARTMLILQMLTYCRIVYMHVYLHGGISSYMCTGETIYIYIYIYATPVFLCMCPYKLASSMMMHITSAHM